MTTHPLSITERIIASEIGDQIAADAAADVVKVQRSLFSASKLVRIRQLLGERDAKTLITSKARP
jgi:hypothetical protein